MDDDKVEGKFLLELAAQINHWMPVEEEKREGLSRKDRRKDDEND